MTAVAVMLVLLLAPLADSLASGKPPDQAGAYCPFPKKGEKPECFAPVERKYSAFFAAVESGEGADEQVEVLADQLAENPDSADSYLAISSLAYGYFRLAQRAGQSDNPDPALVERLNRLNGLLSSVYEDPNAQPGIRGAVRAAAEDLHARAPAIATECANGATGADCQTTGRLLSALKAIDDPSADRGVRGALSRLLERVTGDDGPPLTQPASDSTQ
jgi:hypothetical protein